ncbi:hypothetical protein J2S90_002426 [Arthrobacter bambusae]|uniref:Uncharacterized protein n=1 Tax=Arthrobacter bambusae TaxID=1338426 RepID=A0AAW8DIQ8_9MICC|nr:hypothetical protein [Arthrobacter bambusae]MDQ0127463.1 hypothetical protein [Arthrobacter bambusae]MDQ0178805.1 hypothetical protein [Arthrobacter bambusae]
MDQKLGLGGTKVRQCRQMMAEEMSSVEAAEAVNWSRPRLPANGLQPSLTGCVLYAIPSPRPCLGSVVLEIRRGVPVFGIRCRAGVVSYPPCGAPLCVVFVLGQWEMAISCAEGLQRRSFSLASFLELSLVSQGIHNPENSMSGSQAASSWDRSDNWEHRESAAHSRPGMPNVCSIEGRDAYCGSRRTSAGVHPRAGPSLLAMSVRIWM